MAAVTPAPATNRPKAYSTFVQRARPFVPAAVLLAIVIGYYWRITLTYEFEWFWGPDLAGQVLPWFDEEARQMQHSRFPLWDPHGWGGQPMLGQGQPGAAYPLNWLLFLTPRTHGHINMIVLAWYFVAIHFMAAWFCFLLCRDLGLSKFSSVVGGIVFSFAAYVGTIMWPQMVNGAVWAPLVFMFLLRTVRGYRPLASAALCGLFWGMAWLSGHHQVPLYISLAAGFTWIYYAVRDRSWRLGALAIISAVFMFCTAALQLLPAAEYGRLAKRWVSAPMPVGWNDPVPYAVHGIFSFSPFNAFAILFPGLGATVDPFLGIVAFSLAIIAVAAAWRRPEVKLFAALAIGGFAYTLGIHNVFQGLLYAIVPMVEKARSPYMATVILGFGAAVLAAFGVEQLRIRREAEWVRRGAWILLGAGLILCVVMFCFFWSRNFAIQSDDRFAMTMLIAVGAGALLLGWHRGALSPRSAGALLVGLMLIELGNMSGNAVADRSDYGRMQWLHKLWKNRDIADFLNAQRKPFRIDIDTNELAQNWGEYNNIDELKTDLASVTVNETVPEFWSSQGRSLFNVRYTVGRSTVIPNATQVFEGAGGIKVFENPHALPRAWAVHKLLEFTKESQAHDFIRDRFEDLRYMAFELSPSGINLPVCGATDDVTVTRYEPERVDIRANMACDGMVVLADTFYPGWKATIDGKPAVIHEVDFTMRGISVPRGNHQIKYRYRPASVYLGGTLTALGILGACFLAFFTKERRSPIDLSAKSRNNQD